MRRSQIGWSTAPTLALAILRCMGPVMGKGSVEDYAIRQWTADDGLAQNRVSALAQTPDGYLWIGCWLGLTRFDGVRFQTFNRYNTPGWTDDSVSDLAVTPDGTLHIATRSGLFRFQKGVVTQTILSSELQNAPLWDLAVDSSGRLWADSDKYTGPLPDGPFTALATWRHPTWSLNPKLIPQLNGEMVGLVLSGGWLLPGTNQPLIHPPPTSLPSPFPQLEVLTAAGDGQGGWWLGGPGRLWHWTAQHEWHSLWSSPWRDQGVDLMFRDGRGTGWANVRQLGLHRLNASQLEPFHLKSRGSAPDATAFFEDRDGNLWVGTTQGLFQVRPRLITAFTREDGLGSDGIQSLTESPDGAIWVTSSSGWARLRPGTKRFEASTDMTVGRGLIAADGEGAIWTDHYESDRLVGLNAEGVIHKDLLLHARMQSLYVDRQDRLWVGLNTGVRCFRHGQEIQLTNLPPFEVRASYQTRDGALWFGTWGHGAYRWQESTLTAVTHAQGLADDRVFAFHEDAEGYLWIGTHNGLTRLPRAQTQTGSFTFTTRQGLLDNLINHILEDDEGSLWLSCNRGIFRMKREDLAAVAEGRIERAACDVYGTADGMPSSETNGEHQPAGCKARDGRLWFPTTAGLAVIDPSRVVRQETPPTLVLEEVSIDQVPVDLSHAPAVLELEPGRAREVQFRYTIPGFVNAGRSRFRYRLHGLNEDWHEAGEERVAYFRNLKPGHYTFEVFGVSPHGTSTATPAQFSFRLAPRFVETPWYPFSWVAAGSASALGLFAWRLRWQKRTSAASEALRLEQERSRIAADLHDELGSRLIALSFRSSDPALAQDLRQAAERVRELVWAVDPKADSLDGLISFLVDTAERLTLSAGLALQLDLPSPLPAISLAAGVRRHLALAVLEALTNAMRHSGAQRLRLGLELSDTQMRLTVEDDGCGGVAQRSGGRGLSTMRSRMTALGGGMEIQPAAPTGTRVVFWVARNSNQEVTHG